MMQIPINPFTGVTIPIESLGVNGWLDYEKAMAETLLSIHRAGADVVITYLAKDYARLVKG